MENKNEIKCEIYKKCSGCQLMNLDYESQLALKQKTIRELLGKFDHVNKIIPMENPYHYRNKVQAVMRFDTRTKRAYTGIFQSTRNSVIPAKECLIEDELLHKITGTVLRLCKRLSIPVCDYKGKGFLKSVSLRYAFATGEVMLTLISTSDRFPQSEDFVSRIRKAHPEIKTIVLNINPNGIPLTFGNKEKILFGEGYITDILCNKTFRISPQSFYQINPVGTEILYSKAIEFASLKGTETVVDAYCGIGTIGICASGKIKRLIGIEQNASAVRDANINAGLNNIQNAEFFCGDSGEIMQKIENSGVKIDVVFMDPARAGADRRFLNALRNIAPEKIVYISCNPETLARDLSYLSKDYRITKIQPVDMFPMTKHIETVVLLSQQKPDDVIEVEIELDELDLTSAESKATYAEIKDYVLKEHGLKVSNLYISQVKRKCGIEVGENYNLPKSEDSKQPQCPEEKEKAIRDALEHFGMI